MNGALEFHIFKQMIYTVGFIFDLFIMNLLLMSHNLAL